MIRIKLTKKDNVIEKVDIKGHADYAEYGKDVVCSAVSSIACAALLGLIEFSSRKVEYIKKEGHLSFTVPEAQSAEERIRTEAILKTMELGLRDIQKGYSAFVKMEE